MRPRRSWVMQFCQSTKNPRKKKEVRCIIKNKDGQECGSVQANAWPYTFKRHIGRLHPELLGKLPKENPENSSCETGKSTAESQNLDQHNAMLKGVKISKIAIDSTDHQCTESELTEAAIAISASGLCAFQRFVEMTSFFE